MSLQGPIPEAIEATERSEVTAPSSTAPSSTAPSSTAPSSTAPSSTAKPKLTVYDALLRDLPEGTDPRVEFPPLNALIAMLSTMRPAWSQDDENFCADYLEPLGAVRDEKGNFWLEILNPDETRCPVLWSSHTDTVHSKSGPQRLAMSRHGVLMLAGKPLPSETRTYKYDPDSPNCLGGDCTTGVWLMCEMIRASVPGLYIFHRAEEKGGVGSRWIAANLKDKISHCKFAIAFDRKGYRDIITRQGFDTASTEFATSLAALLRPLDYEPSPHGLFTDTQSYAGIIPECTNLSVGYHNAHSNEEWQHYGFALVLRQVLVSPEFCRDLQLLEATRTPAERSYAANPTKTGWDYWDDNGATDYEGRDNWRNRGNTYVPRAPTNRQNPYTKPTQARSCNPKSVHGEKNVVSLHRGVQSKGGPQGVGVGGNRAEYTQEEWDKIWNEAEEKASQAPKAGAKDSTKAGKRSGTEAMRYEWDTVFDYYPEEFLVFMDQFDLGSGKLADYVLANCRGDLENFLDDNGFKPQDFWQFFVDEGLHKDS